MIARLRRRFELRWWGRQVDLWAFGPWPWDGIDPPYRWSFGFGPLEIRRKKQ